MKITKRQLRRIINESSGNNPWIDGYLKWVRSEGHITPAASSVIASFLISRGIESIGHMKILGDEFGVALEDIEREFDRQSNERGFLKFESTIKNENKMKITKRQLRRIIREEKARLLRENVGHGIFNTDYIYDLLEEELMAYSEGQVTSMEWETIRRAILDAVDRLEGDWVRR